jgi:tRNA(Ile2) C34 agmatinyltransferase TiaS
MSAVATESTAAGMERPQTSQLFEPHEVALEEIILRAWEDLAAEGCAGCPVCGGSMLAADGCAECGSQLS